MLKQPLQATDSVVTKEGERETTQWRTETDSVACSCTVRTIKQPPDGVWSGIVSFALLLAVVFCTARVARSALAGLLVLLVPGCCWAYSASSVEHNPLNSQILTSCTFSLSGCGYLPFDPFTWPDTFTWPCFVKGRHCMRMSTSTCQRTGCHSNSCGAHIHLIPSRVAIVRLDESVHVRPCKPVTPYGHTPQCGSAQARGPTPGAEGSSASCCKCGCK